MTSQGLFAGEFPADVLPTQLRELLKEAAPALLDGLFEDLRAIESVTIGCRESGDTFVVAIESTSVISMLPPAYRAWYSPLFVRALIVCATRIGQALSGGDGAEPTCTAEELIWHLLLQEAIATYESQELSPGGRSDLADDVARFEDFIYQDADWRLLYDHSESEREAAANTSPALQDIIQPVESWFESFYGVTAQPNPYCRDLTPGPVDLVTGRPT
jgi:hypothetical protein